MMAAEVGAEWRTVPGYDDIYVTADGRVMTTYGRRPGIRKPVVSRAGYPMVVFQRKGRTPFGVSVHTLVLTAFVGPRPAGQECRHLNGIKTDCRLENLRWGTPIENGQDRIRHGHQQHGEDRWNAHLTEENVIEARRLRKGNPRVWTYRKLARRYGVTRYVMTTAVSEGVVGKTWKHLDDIEPRAIRGNQRRLTVLP